LTVYDKFFQVNTEVLRMSWSWILPSSGLLAFDKEVPELGLSLSKTCDSSSRITWACFFAFSLGIRRNPLDPPRSSQLLVATMVKTTNRTQNAQMIPKFLQMFSAE
jgi:hypothetical protein